MSAGTVSRVLREALDILRIDAPAAYHRVARELTGIAVDITVDAEMFNVQVLEDAVAVGAHLCGAPAIVTTSTDTILDLTDGRLTYLEAIRSGRLTLRGNLALMLPLARASTAFAEGAVRSPRIKGPLALLREARRGDVAITVLDYTIGP
jgi:hypothetical protein